MQMIRSLKRFRKALKSVTSTLRLNVAGELKICMYFLYFEVRVGLRCRRKNVYAISCSKMGRIVV